MQGAQEAMVELGAQEAMVEQGAPEAMVGGLCGLGLGPLSSATTAGALLPPPPPKKNPWGSLGVSGALRG